MGKYNPKKKSKGLTKKARKISKGDLKKLKRKTKKGKKSPLRKMMSLSNSSSRSKSLSQMSLNSLLPSPVTSPARAIRQAEKIVNSLSPNNKSNSKPRRSTRLRRPPKRYGQISS